LAAIKAAMDVLSAELHALLSDDDTYPAARTALLAAHVAADHYDTTLCLPQDWQLNANDGLSDLYSLAVALQSTFAGDAGVVEAAITLTGATETAILNEATIRRGGFPWFAGQGAQWSFAGNGLGLAVYSDFQGVEPAGGGQRTVGWQAYWYTPEPFGGDAPAANFYPLRFVTPAQAGARTWADVLQIFWQGPDGDNRVPSWACGVPMPLVHDWQVFAPLSPAPFELRGQ
jgi:hypothetical protein